jgi:hypothetical protein
MASSKKIKKTLLIPTPNIKDKDQDKYNKQFNAWLKEQWQLLSDTEYGVTVQDESSFLVNLATTLQFENMGLVDDGNGVVVIDPTAVPGGSNNKVSLTQLTTPGFLGGLNSDGVLRTTNPMTYVVSGDHVTISMDKANSSTDGYLDSNDFAIFSNHIADEDIHFTEGSIDHGNLNLSSLADDDHLQYLLLAGRGGQTIDDAITINDDLTINGGDIIFTPTSSNWKIFNRSEATLAFEGNLPSYGGAYEFYNSANTRSQNNFLRVVGLGTSAPGPIELFNIGWENATQTFSLYTEHGGALIQPITLRSGANTDQIRLNTNGNILMAAGDLEISNGDLSLSTDGSWIHVGEDDDDPSNQGIAFGELSSTGIDTAYVKVFQTDDFDLCLTGSGGVRLRNDISTSIFDITGDLTWRDNNLGGHGANGITIEAWNVNAPINIITDDGDILIYAGDGDITLTADNTNISGNTYATIFTASQPHIDHDSLFNFVGNEHIDHSAVILTAGIGLDGGGDITTSRTFDANIGELEGLISHSNIQDLNVVDDHLLYLDLAGTRPMTGSLLMADNFIEDVGYVQFDTLFTDGQNEGRLQWNIERGTLEFGLPGGVVNLQIGQEFVKRVTNITGVTIPDGTPVYISGVSGNNLTIAPADADYDLGLGFRTYAITTEEILHNDKGYITKAGVVGGINLSAYAGGIPLYLAVGGGYTITPPIAPNVRVLLGTVEKATADGEFDVKIVTLPNLNSLSDVHNTDLAERDILKWNYDNNRWENRADPTITLNEPTGFPNRTDSELSFIGRDFEISPVADEYTIWQQGKEYTITETKSFEVDDTSGYTYIYFDEGELFGVLNPSHAQLDFAMENYVLAGLLYWNSNTSIMLIGADERHGTNMDGATHHYLHDIEGSRYESGFTADFYELDTASDAALTFEVSNGEMYDEDINVDVEDDGIGTAPYKQILNTGDAIIPVLYRDDIDGSWVEQAASTLPYINNGDNTNLNINFDDGDGTWSQVPLTNQRFMSYTLVVTNDSFNPVKMIQGQVSYLTANAAVEGAQSEIVSFGDFPSTEVVLLYRFVMQTGIFAGVKNAKIIEVIDFREVTLTGGGATPTDHGNLSGLSDDDHLQYLLLSGRGGQTIDDEITINGDLTIDSRIISVGDGSGDNPTIVFNSTSGPAEIKWDDNEERFDINHSMLIDGDLTIGDESVPDVTLNFIGAGNDANIVYNSDENRFIFDSTVECESSLLVRTLTADPTSVGVGGIQGEIAYFNDKWYGKIVQTATDTNWVDISEGGGGVNRSISLKTNDYTIVSNDYTILADCSSNDITISLPLNPVNEMYFNIKSIASAFDTTIDRNGKNIDGAALDIDLVVNQSMTLHYHTTYGWVII